MSYTQMERGSKKPGRIWDSGTRPVCGQATRRVILSQRVEGFRAVFWDAPKDLRNAVEDIVALLEYLRDYHQNIRQGTTSQLLVLCNRTTVHNQLLQHGFQTNLEGWTASVDFLVCCRSHSSHRSHCSNRVWFPQRRAAWSHS